MGVLYSFLWTTTISLLLHRVLYALQYISNEISTYGYDFQRVATCYPQIFRERRILILSKKTDGNAKLTTMYLFY